MPSAAIPPELVDVTIGPAIVDMLCAFVVENISRRAAGVGYWSAGCGGQVGVMPAIDVPSKLVDVNVGPLVDDVLAIVFVTRWNVDR